MERRAGAALGSLPKRNLVIGTAGHIDHGKSALVRCLTGIDPDRLKEERERGITIDLGFAHCEIDDLTVAFVDVPGHERFVRNMLAGAGGIDAVMLVVAADESVKPQTREHFAICRLLGLRVGLVALTKADLVDDDTLERARGQICELAAGSFLEGRPVVSVSSVTGSGVEDLRRALVALAEPAGRRDPDGPLRLPIDRVFSIRGFGTVLTGTVVSGTVSVDDELMLLPQGRRVKIRGVQVHGNVRTSAAAGQRVAVNLGGIETSALARGDSLVTPGSLEPTRVIDARIETLPDARPLTHDARIRFHQGTSEVIGRLSIAQVIGAADHDEVAPGRAAYVRLRLERPAVVTRGDRFILRAYSPPATIAGGEVLDSEPPRGSIRSAAALARWTALAGIDGEQGLDRALGRMVDDGGIRGVRMARLAARAGGDIRPVRTFVEQGVAGERSVAIGDLVLSAGAVRELEGRLCDVLSAYHQREPLSDGMPREEARERVCGRTEAAVFQAIVARLVGSGLVRAGDRLALEPHRVATAAADRAALAEIAAICLEAGLSAPDSSALTSATAGHAGTIDRLVARLVHEKVLVRVAGRLYHAQTLSQLRTDVTRWKAEGKAEIGVGDFKERFGLTRKYAIPLLEYLDRERMTRRQGDRRVIL
jgi:selenocysteine-specific elongation factor